ncbi:hypothetical protein E2C01_043434 [Portunus trituberculatus]|uniref:Uncharacterized protein n=1 Tax=Portunus trituberculatus TaxID=210409 RepID=A0A5B7FVR1_PORTR|nr:hypothetical protein [Portunus trituberculatus]
MSTLSATFNGGCDQTSKVLYLSDNTDIPPNCRHQILLPHDNTHVINVFSRTSKLSPGLGAAPTVSSGVSSRCRSQLSSEQISLQKGWKNSQNRQKIPWAWLFCQRFLTSYHHHKCDLRNLLMDYGDTFALGTYL